DRDVLRGVPGVRAVLPQQNTFINLDGRQAILYVTPLQEAQRAGVAGSLHDADLAADPAAFRAGIRSGGIAISRLAAHNRGLKAGDTTTLPTPGGAHRFRISSVFDDFAGEETMYVDRD